MKWSLSAIAFLLLAAIPGISGRKPARYDQLIGTWIFTDLTDKTLIYAKSKTFMRDNSGMKFKHFGRLTKRQNTGWCATPPVAYGNYGGSWKLISDTAIKIQYHYWGGVAENHYKIIELNSDTLKLKSTYHCILRKKYLK